MITAASTCEDYSICMEDGEEDGDVRTYVQLCIVESSRADPAVTDSFITYFYDKGRGVRRAPCGHCTIPKNMAGVMVMPMHGSTVQ